jgi:glycosyltransferase involved in cell wall biosynthesis
VPPRVSFVVPCYNLGHLVGDCVESILSQSFTDLEVIVMDDCSPDDTASVIAQFSDRRLVYVRNEVNLRHLRNYNKGIGMAQGQYIGLISADDTLRDSQMVERLVGVLEAHPQVGYAFCPAVRFTNAGEIGVVGSHGTRDEIFDGREFLRRWLVRGNSVPAAAGLVRRTCYEQIGAFPLDMPFAGDWYLWSIFALHFDVGYLAKPMVGYRAHDANMTLDFKSRPPALVADILRVRWRMKSEAETAGIPSIARLYLQSIAEEYAYRLTQENTSTGSYRLTVDDFEGSLVEHGASAGEAAYLRAVAYAELGDAEFEQGRSAQARSWYRKALQQDGGSVQTRVKSALTRLGPAGRLIRHAIVALRQTTGAAALPTVTPLGSQTCQSPDPSRV